MTTYSYTTFAEAKTRLANLLGDSSKTFWTDAELGLYIQESLRWWGLTSMYWKVSGKFDTVPGQAIYDVRDSIEDLAGNLIMNTTITDRDLITDINYALIEPPITNWAGGWIGSEMFSLQEIADILSRSRDDILRMSGVLAEEQTYPVNPAVARVDLIDTTIHILRCAIQEVSSTGQPLPMWAIDFWQAQSYLDTAGTWPTGRPKAYMTNYTPTLALDLFPDPLVNATLLTYSILAGGQFNPTVSATVMGLPQDACLLAKYRTIADLLEGDGLASAPQESQYCERRVLDGLDALEQYQSLLWASLNNKRVTISGISQLDSVRPQWQSVSGMPRSLHQINWNLFAVYPVPDNIYRIEVEVVRNAIVPVADSDFLQIGREQIQAVYDYAQHIAMFKMQGEEFQATMPLYQQALSSAQEHQAAVAGSSVNYAQQLRQAENDRLMRPYRRRELVQQEQQSDKYMAR